MCALPGSFHSDVLEQFLCMCLPHGFVGLLVCGLRQLQIFLFERKFTVGGQPSDKP